MSDRSTPPGLGQVRDVTPDEINALNTSWPMGPNTTGYLSNLVWNLRNQYLMWPNSTVDASSVKRLVEGFMAELRTAQSGERETK